MGFNSVVFFCNDAHGAIDKDPAGWWEACKSAFGRQKMDKPEMFIHGNRLGYWEAVAEHHADIYSVILAGGNCATVLGSTMSSGRNTGEIEDQIKILRDTLRPLGYTIRKLPNKEKS